MYKFTVWAPGAKKMAVKIGDALHPMSGPDDTGWWNASIDAANNSTDYSFVLDDDATPYPDPRGLWQPHGVHGPSRVYDHDAFAWNDSRWQGPPLSGAVIYEMHVGTFTAAGTFAAAIERLNYLFELGITHIELMPVVEFPGKFGWGYDGVALFAVKDLYGGPDGLKRFVDACHSRGLAVLMDVVYNHFGPVGNYTTKFGPYLTHRHNTPWGDAVNFEEAGADEVRRFFCDNALMWMRDYHVDGLRLDAVHEFVDRSAIHFMEQLSAEVEILSSTLERKLVLIAESDLNDPKMVTPREAGGYGMDAQWSDDFHHALFTILNIEVEGKGYYVDFGSFERLAKALTAVFVYDGVYSQYRRHTHGRPVHGLSAHHFIGFIQNHDQVGNRATGDRLEHIVGMERAKVAIGIVLMSPFVPLIFQGDEFAASSPFQYFADHDEPAMVAAVREGRKREFAAFGWNPDEIPNPDEADTFQRSKLNWDEIHEENHGEMLNWFRQLIQLRRHTSCLNDGDLNHLKVKFDEDKRWLTMDRGQVRVLCNLGKESVEFENCGGFSLSLGSRNDIGITNGKVLLPPDSVAILSAKEG
ncbi:MULTISPECIES: malto-oligosyltrehalose trehalohydrolase [Acidobacteriaceae]|uniref:malto-oligosyltrehalose trehalohydrolase n=1 Tax=Acidobacteriaceae TaxID=204434 RepID=UPI00131E3ECC|nr:MULTISPECIES: malto-oligosyltrehalose trehalohydrolase [Acidobacteriaceae]MDW5267759.1 malto-oligosyltrehalose trehalohydrolase [Edaphobacter sp.]